MLEIADLVGFDVGDIAPKWGVVVVGLDDLCITIFIWWIYGDQMNRTHLYGTCHALTIAPI
jgi:hypothetical protein